MPSLLVNNNRNLSKWYNLRFNDEENHYEVLYINKKYYLHDKYTLNVIKLIFEMNDKTIIYKKYSKIVDKKELESNEEKLYETIVNESKLELEVVMNFPKELSFIEILKENKIKEHNNVYNNNLINNFPISGKIRIYKPDNTDYYTQFNFIRGEIGQSDYPSDNALINYFETFYSGFPNKYNFKLKAIIDGKVVKRRRDDTIYCIQNYTDGVKNGMESYYFEDGKTPSFVTNIEYGKYNGLCIAYYSPNVLWYVNNYENDSYDGDQFEWYTNQQLSSYSKYEHNELVEKKHYKWNGHQDYQECQKDELNYHAKYKNNKISSIYYYKNGEIINKVLYNW